MRIGRMHPICNWIRCEGDDYNLTMQKVFAFRDTATLQDPSSSGLPPAAVAWFWSEQLPQLLQQPHYRRQAKEHLASLRLKSQDLGEMIERVAGALLTDQAETDHLANQIQTLLEAKHE